MKYRREVDGLRAVAVVPVILYHAGIAAFSGGFVGVDVFFAISGYLITGIIVDDLAAGRFSILRFYERRARRILPALFLVLLCCLPFAWRWMSVPQFDDFSKSVIAVVTFVSNVLFWRGTDYFAGAAELKPLLHTWSLAVEEQYYVLFPPLMILLWRFGRRGVLPALALIAIASLALSEWASQLHPVANFYLAPTRAWELMLGAIAAVWERHHGSRSNNALAGLGLAAILVAVFAFDATTPSPSLYTLLPVGGSVLILMFARGDTLVARLLATRPFVGIGLVSYSAYLWHQPLFAFARIRSFEPPAPLALAGLGLVSFGLAYLSWRYVETPFRTGFRGSLGARRTVIASLAVMAIALLGVGIAGHRGQGLGFRSSPTGITFAELYRLEGAGPNFGLGVQCDTPANFGKSCSSDSAPDAVLWGDSYAMHLVQALEASPTKLSFVQLTMSGCTPTIGVAIQSNDPAQRAHCFAINDKAIAYIEQHKPRWVVLSSLFGGLAKATIRRDGSVIRQDHLEAVYEAMRNTIERIKATGATPVLVSPPPNDGLRLDDCAAKALAFGHDPNSCNFDATEFSKQTVMSIRLMEKLAPYVKIVRLDKLLCATGRCTAYRDGVAYYREGGHLTPGGSRDIGKRFDLGGLITGTPPS